MSETFRNARTGLVWTVEPGSREHEHMVGHPDEFTPASPEPAPAPSSVEDGPERPAESDRKAAWMAYADGLGIDTAGLTKDELITAVEEAEA